MVCREVLADPVLACHVKRGAVLCRESNAVLTADMEVSSFNGEVRGKFHSESLRIRSMASRIRSTGRVIANRT